MMASIRANQPNLDLLVLCIIYYTRNILTLEMHFDTPGALMDELCNSPGFGFLPFIVLQTGKGAEYDHDMTQAGFRPTQ